MDTKTSKKYSPEPLKKWLLENRHLYNSKSSPKNFFINPVAELEFLTLFGTPNWDHIVSALRKVGLPVSGKIKKKAYRASEPEKSEPNLWPKNLSMKAEKYIKDIKSQFINFTV